MPTIIESGLPARYFGNKAGRKPGSRNRISHSVKENIQKVFDGLGGWESMMDWAVLHRSEFYGQVYPRLLANEGVTKNNGDIRVLVYAPQGKDSKVSEAVDDVMGQNGATSLQAEAQAGACLTETQAENPSSTNRQ